MLRWAFLAAMSLVVVLYGCRGSGEPVAQSPVAESRSTMGGSAPPAAPGTTALSAPTTTVAAVSATTTVPKTPPSTILGRPPWLGTRTLPLRPDGFGEVQPTPPELVDRRLPTLDVLPPPAGGDFVSTIAPVPPEVAERSTWSAKCPVGLEELSYLTVSFWGFDGQAHTGELIVNADVADAVVGVFHSLYRDRFPIEEMRVVRADELTLPPTGDGNNTTSFVCRAVTNGRGWSQHAFGLAIDINPFQNPYHKADLVVPELASAYLDRTDVRPGMILEGDALTGEMRNMGWEWGGAWTTVSDPMHFSRDGG